MPKFWFHLFQAENKNEAPQYDGTWRDADPAKVKAKMDAGVTYTYRFKVPKGKVGCRIFFFRDTTYCSMYAAVVHAVLIPVLSQKVMLWNILASCCLA